MHILFVSRHVPIPVEKSWQLRTWERLEEAEGLLKIRQAIRGLEPFVSDKGICLSITRE